MTGDDRDSMMDSLRAAADIVGVASTTTSTDQGADCVIDTYQPDTDGVSWQVQGCSYEKFPGLVSLGISRTGPTDDPPPLIDPTIATVADTIDGSVTFVEVRLGEPGAGSVDPASLRASQPPSSGSSPLLTRWPAGRSPDGRRFPVRARCCCRGRPGRRGPCPTASPCSPGRVAGERRPDRPPGADQRMVAADLHRPVRRGRLDRTDDLVVAVVLDRLAGRPRPGDVDRRLLTAVHPRTDRRFRPHRPPVRLHDHRGGGRHRRGRCDDHRTGPAAPPARRARPGPRLGPRPVLPPRRGGRFGTDPRPP